MTPMTCQEDFRCYLAWAASETRWYFPTPNCARFAEALDWCAEHDQQVYHDYIQVCSSAIAFRDPEIAEQFADDFPEVAPWFLQDGTPMPRGLTAAERHQWIVEEGRKRAVPYEELSAAEKMLVDQSLAWAEQNQ